MLTVNENNTPVISANPAVQAALDIDSLVELAKEFKDGKFEQLPNDSKAIVKASLESIDARYGSKAGVALESMDTVMGRAKEMIKRIIEAIIESIEKLISLFNRYRTEGEAIIIRVNMIESLTRGHIGLQRRSVRVQSNELATSLFLSKGGGDVRAAYRKVIDIATSAFDVANYQGLENILNRFQSASEDQIEPISEDLLKTITEPVRKLLTNHNPPAVVADRNTRENSDLICAGPFLGERYIYAYCPTDPRYLNEFYIGSIRNHEAMVVREKLVALSTSDIWDVCQKARNFAELIIDFGSVDVKLKKLLATSRNLIKTIDSPKVVSAIAIFPIALRGLHYTALNMGVDTTFSMLEYCQKSIKAQISAETNTSTPT